MFIGTEIDPDTGKLPYESMDKGDNQLVQSCRVFRRLKGSYTND
jgi:hypothetical protein